MTSTFVNRPFTIDTRPEDLDPTLSHAVGNQDVELLDETIGQALARVVTKFPKNDAVLDLYGDVQLNYEEFHRRVQRLASGLHAAGYRKGDRIGIWAPNRWEWTVVQFAAAEIGLVLVCINPTYRKRELIYAMNQSNVKGLFSAGRYKDSNYRSMVFSASPEFSRAYEETIFFGSERWNELSNHAIVDLNPVRDELHPDDPINIQYTSGTTGMAKGATLTHRNILNNGFMIGHRLSYTEKDRVVIPVPFFHCFGMVIGNLAAMARGAATIIPGPAFQPQQTLEAVHHGQATSLYGVPTMFMAELQELEKNPDKYDLSSLRTGVMAGTTCPSKTMQDVIDIMGMEEVGICYGMTETSPVSCQTLPDDPLDKRVNTVGKVGPHLEVKIVDPHSREVIPRGQQGEVMVRGYSVMKGYWDMPEKTAGAVTDDGWMLTGDLGLMDEDGYLAITGRIKDMVIRGGENLYPKEIEEFFYGHPDIADVQVIGVPDEKYGEELMAWIIMNPGAKPLTQEDVKAFADGNLARHKIPRYVHIVDSYPMTISGKVRKVAMREEAVKILGTYQR